MLLLRWWWGHRFRLLVFGQEEMEHMKLVHRPLCHPLKQMDLLEVVLPMPIVETRTWSE